MKRKILVTTGTRAEYGILRQLLFDMVKSKKIELILVVTGSHLSKKYGFTIQEIIQDGFKINAKIKIEPKKDDAFSASMKIGKTTMGFSKIFKKFKPDINVIIGDRDEMLASAIAASHMNIINAHIQGGDISGGLDEYNRHAITKLSNIHFAATKKSMRRILRMGENPKFVFQTGSLSIDEIKLNKITRKKILEKKYDFKFTGSEILLLQHPVTTETKESEKQIKISLKALTRTKQNIIAIAPNSDPGNSIIFNNLKKWSEKHKSVMYFQNIPRSEYLGFLKNCAVLVGNSSSGIVESTLFNIQVIDLGIRQKCRERERSVICIEKPTSDKIFTEIMKSMSNSKINKKTKIYGNGKSSKKILKYLENIPMNKKLIQKQFYNN